MKTVLITGANRGIGFEFCRQYLAKGYQVFACCRRPESSSELLALKQKNAKALSLFPLDVTREAMMTALAYSLESQPIDILINNAGVYGLRAVPFGAVSEEEWLSTLRVNTIAPLMLTQLLASNLVASKEKKLVLLSSKMGSVADNGSGGSYIYRSSKSALNAVGKSLAHDLSAKGISVAIVHPGWVKTDMGGTDAWIGAEESVTGLIGVIDKLELSSSGQFFSYDGSIIPW